MSASAHARRRAAATLLTGAACGAIVLGLGGRLAMRVIALQSGSPGILTPSGTTTVVLAGVASGLGGALLHLVASAIARRIAPGRPWVRRALFGILLVLVTLRGLHPVQPLPLALFGPLVILYAVVIEVAAARREGLGRESRPPTVVAV